MPPSHLPPEAAAVLDFWLLPEDHLDHGKQRALWFSKDDGFDHDIRARFGSLIALAIGGHLDAWQEHGAKGVLALLIVMDQMTRNAFRGTSGMYAGDPRALPVALDAIAKGLDQQVPPVFRKFFYLPLEHAEDLQVVRDAEPFFRALEAYEETRDEGLWYDKHRVIVERFGRYPHRNALLNRPSTPEEAAFLLEPDSSF